jgi:CheY-like chemotaxis protein
MTKTVVVAEDDPFFRETIELRLKEQGVNVKLARNGQEAIDMVEEQIPDLLVLDLLMPKLDGFAVLAHGQKNGWDFPIVVLSNLLDEVDSEKCLRLGAKDYFVKNDMDEDELWPKISRFL